MLFQVLEHLTCVPRPGLLKMEQMGFWSCPNSPDTLTFLNKVIGFNDIGSQFFNTQVPFKFVG